MEGTLMKVIGGGIRNFYVIHSELMETMIPAVEAVERLASSDSSDDSEAAKSKSQAIDAPQDYSSLPTVHVAETATCHISELVQKLDEQLHSVNVTQTAVRPLLDRLNHLFTICELHDLEEPLMKCGEASAAFAQKNGRFCDAAFFTARMILFLCNQRPVVTDNRFVRLRDLTARISTPSAESDWPEFKLIVIKIAKCLGTGFLNESAVVLRESIDSLGQLDEQHRTFFLSKVKEAVLARAVLLQARLLLRLRAGPLLPTRDESPLDAAILLRRLGYSLVRFHFDRMNKAPQPKKGGKDRYQDEAWQAVSMLMNGCYWTCWTHTFLGANRESRCYLREFLKFAQTYYLPYKAHACLTLQAHLDFHGHLESYRAVRLAQMKNILTDPTLPKRIVVEGESMEGEEEENFLHYRQSPLVARDEHLPDVPKSGAHLLTDYGASPTLIESEQSAEKEDLYTREEPRLPWLQSALTVLRDTKHVKEALADLAVSAKQKGHREAAGEPRDEAVANIIDLVSDLHTPSAEVEETKVPGAPRKQLGGETRTIRRRPKRTRAKAAAKEEVFDVEGVARMCSHLSLAPPARRGRPRVLADATNARTKAKTEPEGDVEVAEDDIEFCPTAQFVPRNVRIARRLELQRNIQAAERVRSCQEFARGESLLPLIPDGLPVLDKSKSLGINKELVSRLEESFQHLRWFPPAEMFRQICHRLAVHFLLVNDTESASFYLSQSVFVAMKQMYQSNLVQKLRRGANVDRWEMALNGCRSAFEDVHSWRTAVNQLPEDWTILQFTFVEADADHLIITRLRPNQEPASRLCKGFDDSGISLLGEFDVIMQDNIDAMSLRTKKEWWDSRYRLNDAISEWAERCRTQWFPPVLRAWMLPGSGPVILILDRRLNSLPFELILENDLDRVFTRMTNLAVVLAHYNQVRGVLRDGIDLNKAFYVLNPDKDLEGTQVTLQPVFDSFGWSGLVGQQPKEEELLSALSKYDLLTYCGHGSGTKYLHLQALQNCTSRAVALLVGCSSGKLYPEGTFEPNGNVLSHLMAGSPSVLALLWDVTDRDIDRYFKRLLTDWWEDSVAAFGVLARRSRSACKLVFLVGCAPVIYGLPIDKQKKLSDS